VYLVEIEELKGCTMTAAKTRWQIGDTAPDLTMTDIHGVAHELQTVWQHGGLVISFLRHFG
jgi:hypothetical protein